jgi:dolichol-phosphate mannosyltransferase
MVFGLINFWLACSFGAWANVSFAENLLRSGVPWYVAGFAGTVLSAVWNYSVSSLFTWQMPQPRRVSDTTVFGNAVPSDKPAPPPPGR